MMFSEVMDRFVEQSAVSVMFRGTLENAIIPELLDEVFAQTAKRQRCGELLFSSVVNLLGLVATGIRKSVNAAYKAKKEQFTVSVAAVYDKLNGVETEVSRQMVRQTALRMTGVGVAFRVPAVAASRWRAARRSPPIGRVRGARPAAGVGLPSRPAPIVGGGTGSAIAGRAGRFAPL